MTHSKPTRPTVIHFPPKLHAAIKEIAEARGVSVTSLVIKACDEFVYGQNQAEYYTENAYAIREYPTVRPEGDTDATLR